MAFSKKNLLNDLEVKAKYLQKKYNFTTGTGYAQVLDRDKEANRAYGEWDFIKSLIVWIRDGDFGTGPKK